MGSDFLDSTALVSRFSIEQQIFAIRGIQIMIDRDLAQPYGVEPKRLGEQVRRNIDRFPEAFRFQLTNAEKNELVANCDQFEPLKHTSARPYAFVAFDFKRATACCPICEAACFAKPSATGGF